MIEYLTPYQKRLAALLLKGHDNLEIARLTRTPLYNIKRHFTRLFKGFNITSGCKRIRLAVILHNLQQSN